MTFAEDAAPYDKRDGSPFFAPLGGSHTISGTAASSVAITGSYYRVPFACKLVGANFTASTGDTTAGPVIHIDRSVGGTGTYAAIATGAAATIGTIATAGTADLTVTAVDLAAGDQLRIENQILTSAGQLIGTVVLELVSRADSVQ